MTQVVDVAISDRVPILVYHSISDDPHPYICNFTVSPRTFGRHLDMVEAAGLTALTVSQFAALRRGGGLPERPVLITFDDGWADTLTEALPQLHQRGMPATLYVTTGFLQGGSRPTRISAPMSAALRWSDLHQLAAGGVELGAHTVSHPELDAVRRRTARLEIATSRHDLQQYLGHAVESFAYPHGYQDRAVRAMVAAAGYTSACVVKNAFASRHDDPMALARILVRSDTSLATMHTWLRGFGAPVDDGRDHWRTRAWRSYRRSRAALNGAGRSAAIAAEGRENER